MLGLQFSREHQLSKTVEWDKVAQGLGLAGSRWHFFTVKIVRLLIFSFIWKCLLRKTSYLVLSLPDHEFCPFLSRNSHENYPGRLHIEWLCDCSVIVLRRSDFRKPFSIKLLVGELEKNIV